MILDTLARRHGTDKASGGHNYCDFYHKFLAPMRDEADLRIMEIGVGTGNSLFMWRDYFPQAEIIGFDINQGADAYAGDRIKIEIGDQGNGDHLNRVVQKYGQFDLILDDGSHQSEHQMFSLTALLPAVKPGRFYILEDVMADTVVYFLNTISHAVMKNSGDWARCQSISFYEQTTVITMKS